MNCSEGVGRESDTEQAAKGKKQLPAQDAVEKAGSMRLCIQES